MAMERKFEENHKQRQLLSTTFCALSKQGHRFLFSLAATAGDSSAALCLIRKSGASSSKPIPLNALSHLLSANTTYPHPSSLALPLYTRITTTSWFNWNPKLMAWFQDGDGDLAIFYCDLIDSYSKRGLKQGVMLSNRRLKQLLSHSPNFSLRRRAFETMIRGLCDLDLPHEAEMLMEEMSVSAGIKPSPYEFRCIVNGYGRTGSWMEMQRVIGLMEDAGYVCDTICSNIVLSSYGAHSELSEMVSWLREMKDSDIQFSVRTYNCVLNSCPKIMSFFGEPKLLPLMMEGLIENSHKSERRGVRGFHL
ncbi:hypothetical protein NE237_014303 [Protea cynaroides]|uniref:Pentatricopeptide repeat-containing protein n=1 Tax=Protea cynaroides TaxID=273540 RepID=A0A9Q0JRU3_9MAGN|nr:hypothetical protein NE237_014303 [Protea cynaroides]